MGNKVRPPSLRKNKMETSELTVALTFQSQSLARFCLLLEEHPRLTKESVQSRTGSESDAFQELQ